MEKKKEYLLKSITWIALLFSFITGIIIYIAPSKELAYLNHWNIFGIERGLFVDVHVFFSVILIILISYLLLRKRNSRGG